MQNYPACKELSQHLDTDDDVGDDDDVDNDDLVFKVS